MFPLVRADGPSSSDPLALFRLDLLNCGHGAIGEGSMGKLSQNGTPTKTMQLDNYPRPDFIKMDIEGEETAALHGSSRILAERRAVWFIATHGSVVRSEISALLTS